MIIELPHSHDSVLGFEITGNVSVEEELKWIDRFDQAIEKQGKVSALVVFHLNRALLEKRLHLLQE